MASDGHAVTVAARGGSRVRKNVGGVDRSLRVVAALALLAYGYRNRSRTVGTLAFLGGSDLLATAVVRRCPANALLGIDTCGADG